MTNRHSATEFLVCACAGLLVSGPGSALADAIVVTRAMKASTIAEIFIEEEEVRVDLEIGVADLPGFANLLPGELLERMGSKAGPLEERLPRFFADDLVIRADQGPPLQGYVAHMEGRERTERDEITGEPLPATDGAVDAVVFARLVYPLEDRPHTLSVTPPGTEAGGTAAANIGFMTYHHGLPVMDFRYLSKEETVVLDWDDPWYSQFENRNLWRSYREPINVFLYAEPYEVRAEIIVRPYDLQSWLDLGLEGKRTIPVETQAELKQKVAAFVGKRMNFTIDGEGVEPMVDRVNFLRRNLRSSTVIDPPEELDIYSATLGVIYVQPTTGLPQEASVTWDLFSPKMDRVRAASTDEAGPLPYYLTPGDTVLTWKNFLKNPTVPTLADVAAPPGAHPRALQVGAWLGAGFVLLVSLGNAVRRRLRPIGAAAAALAMVLLLGIGVLAGRRERIDPSRAEGILLPLLKNVYHAFDFREEEQVYDTLAHSIDGDLLTRVYLDTRRGLELASQGGARVKVKQVAMQHVEPKSIAGSRAFRALCTWNVSGSVGHWGHIHQRTNQYRANVTVAPVDGKWKITAIDLIEEERIS